MKDLYKISTVASLIFAIAWVLLSLLKGECGGMLTCGESQVPMKCHWCYIAVAVLGIIEVALTVLALISKQKEARRYLLVIALAVLIAAIVVMWVAIGVCAKDGMVCIENRTIITVVVVLNMVTACVALAKANPQQKNLPKAEL